MSHLIFKHLCAERRAAIQAAVAPLETYKQVADLEPASVKFLALEINTPGVDAVYEGNPVRLSSLFTACVIIIFRLLPGSF